MRKSECWLSLIRKVQLQQFVCQEHQLSCARRRQTVQFIDYSQSIWTPFIVYLPFISGLYLLQWTHITWCYELLRATMGHYGKNGRPRDALASFNKWTSGTGPHSLKSTAHWVVLIQSGASSPAKHGAYFSAVYGSIQDPIAAPGPYENQEP